MSRLLWHAGYTPGIENYAKARARARKAADILTERVMDGGAVALVAHGYFNAMIGRVLRKRGFQQTGRHRVRYWNAGHLLGSASIEIVMLSDRLRARCSICSWRCRSKTVGSGIRLT